MSLRNLTSVNRAFVPVMLTKTSARILSLQNPNAHLMAAPPCLTGILMSFSISTDTVGHMACMCDANVADYPGLAIGALLPVY